MRLNLPLDSGEKTQQCNFCEKKLMSSTNASRHELTYCIENLHLSSYCESRFFAPNEEKKHKSTHVTFVKKCLYGRVT